MTIRPEGLMKSKSSWFVSLKLFLISAGVLSLAVWVKFVIPLIIHFAVLEIPALWSILLSLLKPPYLFVIINGIIITIAAASRFHHGESEPSDQSEMLISVKTPPSLEFSSITTPIDISTVAEKHPSATEAVLECESEDRVVKVKHVVVNDSEVKNDDVTEAEDEDEFIVSNSTYNLSGAKEIRVTRPETHETLESIWKMITEERHAPLTRPSKKLDTWKDHAYYVTGSKNCVNYDSPRAPLSSYPSLKVRKELSVGRRELNRRVDAFIKKINDEMRMQGARVVNQCGDN